MQIIAIYSENNSIFFSFFPSQRHRSNNFLIGSLQKIYSDKLFERPFVQKVICSKVHLLKRSLVQKAICSKVHLLKRSLVQKPVWQKVVCLKGHLFIICYSRRPNLVSVFLLDFISLDYVCFQLFNNDIILL